MIDWDALVVGPLVQAFGEPIAYQPAAGGASFALTAVFDDAYLALMLGQDGDPEIVTIDPVCGVQLSQFTAAGRALPTQDDRLTVSRVGKTFMVANVEPDGKGHAKLRLTRCDP
jgi:hypothetical protein